MKNHSTPFTHLPPEQKAIWAKCFHPSGTFIEFPIEDIQTSIPERFEKIVQMYPDRIAVRTVNRVVTFAELNAMANRIALLLVTGEEASLEPIGLLLEKGASLMAAMLGVLKAGKFFVLLDPSFPKARIASMLENSQARLILTDRQNVALARDAAGESRAVIDLASTDFPVSSENLGLEISPNALSYIIYTSGSTGQPKGVVQNHRNLLHRVRLYTNAYQICGADRLSLLPTGTSNAVTHGFTALLTGASLFPYDARKQGSAALASWLVDEKISFCWISSPLFRSLAATLTGRERFPDLRLIQLTSETAFRTDVDLYTKYFSRNSLLSCGLSSSETGLLSIFLVDQKTEIFGNEAPVGYAIADKEIVLLDNAGKQVAFNEIGEIVVRSSYLSPGYWERPDLTAAKFKPDPEDPEKRIYYTGDLGLMRPDGCLILKGRKDFRVKVRGYGIELAEVERALLEHAAVREAVVTEQRNYSDGARLVAYFTSISQRPGPSVSDLRAYLKQKLPDYMIPAAFVELRTMPLTSNGKIDRSSLPAPGKSRPELDTLFTLPRTSAEETLAKLWAEVLGLDQIGIHDNFFDLGGNSLLAMRVISRILDRFQVDLPLSHFFETPTIAALASYSETASSPQRGTEALSIQPASRDGKLLLSWAQQRLWFLDQLEPGSIAYNLFSATKLTGRLNVIALERSFNEIIRRHEAFRTVFRAVDGEPVQVILASLTVGVQVVDLGGIDSDTERESEVRRLFTAEAQQPFDLTRGPLLRVTLLRMKEDEHVLLLTKHHIVYDGWSSGILAQELSALYEAFSSGSPLSLPVLPIQYVDFAQWQRRWLQGEVLETRLAYWKKKLEDVPALQLPTDRPRPPVQTFRGARQFFVLSETLSSRLKSLCHKHRVTLFMVLLAAYQTLLHRYTGQNDIVVGSPVAGRNRSEIEGLIGFFLNMLVLRTDLSGNPTFRELLSRVREVCLEAYAHQDLPFEKLVEELHPERDVSLNPLFQVAFVLQNTPLFPLKLAGLTTNNLEFDPGLARFDLRLFVVEEEGRLRGCVDYNTDLFSDVTITRMLDYYYNLLEGIVEKPDRQISRYSLLTQDERRRFSKQSNPIGPTNPFVEFKKQDIKQSICARFEQQARLFPNKLAVKTQEHQWSYAELNRQANRIAHTLLKYCGHGEERIALLFDHGAPMVAAILGVLKSANAYVPLEPSHPQERIAYISGNCQAAIIVTDKKNPAQVLSFGNGTLQVIDIDEIDGAAPTDDPTVEVSPDALAYILYTSGSTGQPKGVMQNHRNVLHHIRCYTNNLHIASDDKITLLSSYGFDAAVMDIFGAVLNGATLCPLDVKADPSALRKWIVEEAVTIYHSTPTVYRYLFAGLSSQEDRSAIRLIVLGGEEAQKADVDLFKKHCSDECVLVNGLGPTESTLALQCFITHKTQLAGHMVPVGYPVEDTEVVLLNESGVDAEVYGEVGIRSAHVALGYWKRPELSEAAFLPDPQGGPRRLYRTGDMGRLLPDGSIGFCGRRDFQVKIRGHRIELGEIEAVLGQHPMVREAVVLAREENPGDKRLVAYVVFSEDQTCTVSELRSFLKEKLPEYMVPSAFVFLDSLPLTPNGKLDRKALPAPDPNRPELEQSFVAPRTPIEEIIAEIWAEVLQIDKVGTHDNFFDLGGHSLLATQVVSRMRTAFQVALPLRVLFEKQNIEELAKAITELQAKSVAAEIIATVLTEIESLSDEEALGLVARKKVEGQRGSVC